jgi:aryl-alcohol dehydrogenase-like predicted oxidoreductase
MHTRKLGKTGPSASILGLGCMGMSGMYGPADRKESIATIHAALEAGINLLDTGDFYGMGHNELLIREALTGRSRDQAILSVKFGAMRDPAGAFVGVDGRPQAVKNALAYSLQRLGTDYIDIYRLARLDPEVPIEDTVGAIADMIKAGHVRHIALSEVGPATLRKALAVHPIVDVQLEYGLFARGPERSLLPACRELGVSVTAYGVLSRGLLGGRVRKDTELAPGDFRKHSPRFASENLDRNLELVEALREIATAQHRSVAQLAIAWVVSRGDEIVPLVGARTRERLREALGALDYKLTADELAQIEAAVPKDAVAGTRYPESMMAHLDSEKD